MIRSIDLFRWSSKINNTVTEARDKAEKYATNEELSKYFLHIVTVGEAQLDLLNRLIEEEAANEREKAREGLCQR